jgi:hypothetical protein
LGLGLTTGPARDAALGQDGQPAASSNIESAARDRIVARLKAVCESDPELHGGLVKTGELRGGRLRLIGTVDRREQAERLEAAARKLLDEEPGWKEQVPGGVTAQGMVVLPVRSVLLPHLRRGFASAGNDPSGLLRQTRLDDLYFDGQGRLHVAGLCINQGAFLARQGAAAGSGEDPLNRIAKGIRDLLPGFAVPASVDAGTLGRLQADRITFAENPARLLQRYANESPQLDDVLFLDASFNGQGALTLAGLLGAEAQRPEAAALLSRPEFVRTYARPAKSPPTDPLAAVAEMSVVPWRPALLEGLQKRLAQDVKPGMPQADLRHCRVDRAVFVYPQRGGLLLRFEGVALLGGADQFRIAPVLREACNRLFKPPRPVAYNVQEALAKLPNPVRGLQSKVAAAPALDGVRLDDLTFGPKGETTFQGRWIGPVQAATLDLVVTPALAEQTQGKVNPPFDRNLTATPSDRLLRSLRDQVAAEFDETSLDRLFYRPAENPRSPPELVLQGATLAARLAAVEARLAGWLKANELSKVVGIPAVELTPRPASLVAELRQLVARDPTLDGVRIDHGVFDAENAFVLSGCQDHDGQAESVLALVPNAAERAWLNLPRPSVVRAGTFPLTPVRRLLDLLARKLPEFPEADGVILDRAFYNAAGTLVLGGRASGPTRERKELKSLVTSLVGDEAGSKLGVELSLKPQAFDPYESSRIVDQRIKALIGGNLTDSDRAALDEAIFLDPSNSTAWYLRAAYYLGTGNRELALRDLRRVRWVESRIPGRSTQRSAALVNFQSDRRNQLTSLMDEAR